ncbi:ATP-grasp domain-containing protein [Rathayibacter iranicus]|uniref:ATP-grasp domain-containing protein n=1 Tax=Rathayibacter iranicus TaxID=59737 RepID=UPI0013652E95
MGSGAAEAYRRYSLEAIAKEFDIILLEDTPVTWQWPFILANIVTDFALADAIIAVDKLRVTMPIDGVLTWDERRVELVGQLARYLGLPGTSPEVIAVCRDKWQSRMAFAKSGTPSAQSRLTSSLGEAVAAAEVFGFPVVVKPRSLAGSIGVRRVETKDELVEAWDMADKATMASVRENTCGVLVEEFLEGEEYSVECVTFRGNTTPIAVTIKRVGFPPYFEELGHIVFARDLDREWGSRLAAVAVEAIQAVGITDGVSHVELKAGEGGPKIIEINARLGGDLIPHLVKLATGVDLSLAAANCAVGEEPKLDPVSSGAAGVYFFYPPTAGEFTGHSVEEWVGEDWVERCVWLQSYGAQMALPPEMFMARLGFAVVFADDSRGVAQRFETIEEKTVITIGGVRTA